MVGAFLAQPENMPVLVQYVSLEEPPLKSKERFIQSYGNSDSAKTLQALEKNRQAREISWNVSPDENLPRR